MTAKEISDLWLAVKGKTSPHAYQIFGLEPGEQDTAKISAAVRRVVSQMKAAKADADPKLWQAAAKLVQAARATLADPNQKAELDARFGIISIDESVPPPPAKSVPAADPLAGMLPPTNPFAAVSPAATPLAPIDAATAPLVPVNPIGVTPSANIPTTVEPAQQPPTFAAAPVVTRPTQPPRRRRSVMGILFFTVFTLGMLGLIAVLGYHLNKHGEFTITTGQDPNAGPSVDPTQSQAAPDAALKPSVPFDPVIGRLMDNAPRARAPEIRSQKNIATSPDPDPVEPQVAMTETPTETLPIAEPTTNEPTFAEPPMNEVTFAEPSKFAAPVPNRPSQQAIAEADAALEKVRELIRGAKWGEMKPAAENARNMVMSADQKTSAEGLYELADLATYYRGGIERAVTDLKTGNDFAVIDDFRIVVVEATKDRLVIRYNAKNRAYGFDEIPLPLAHKLASFSIPEGPTRQASKAAFQAILPSINQGYREQSIDWLRQIDGEVEGADPQRVAVAIESLFSDER